MLSWWKTVTEEPDCCSLKEARLQTVYQRDWYRGRLQWQSSVEGKGQGGGLKNAGLGIRSFQKNVLFSTFFSIQYKRTIRSLLSFPFSTKERFVLYVLFLSVKRTFPSIFEFFLAFLGVKSGFISLQKLKNRTKRLKNERNVHLCSFPFILIINNLFNYFLGFISREKHKKWTEKNVLF